VEIRRSSDENNFAQFFETRVVFNEVNYNGHTRVSART